MFDEVDSICSEFIKSLTDWISSYFPLCSSEDSSVEINNENGV